MATYAPPGADEVKHVGLATRHFPRTYTSTDLSAWMQKVRICSVLVSYSCCSDVRVQFCIGDYEHCTYHGPVDKKMLSSDEIQILNPCVNTLRGTN